MIWKTSNALRTLSICLIHGYLGYALETLDLTSDLFSEDEGRLITKAIKSNIGLS